MDENKFCFGRHHTSSERRVSQPQVAGSDNRDRKERGRYKIYYSLIIRSNDQTENYFVFDVVELFLKTTSSKQSALQLALRMDGIWNCIVFDWPIQSRMSFVPTYKLQLQKWQSGDCTYYCVPGKYLVPTPDLFAISNQPVRKIEEKEDATCVTLAQVNLLVRVTTFTYLSVSGVRTHIPGFALTISGFATSFAVGLRTCKAWRGT